MGDVPYDQFVLEHVAGDLLEKPRLNPRAGFNESIIGTAFWWLGEGKHSPVDLLEDEAERVDNQIDVFAKTFLGLTAGCARCHDHKFDPIPTKDYYALSGYLKSTRYQLADAAPRQPVRELSSRIEAVNTRLGEALRGSSALAEPALRPYLIAAAQPPSGMGACAAPGETVDPAVLQRWTSHLAQARTDPSDLLHAWAVLGALPEDQFPAAREALSRRLEALAASARERESAATVFEDFGRPGYAGWYVSGEAFGAGPTRAPSVRFKAGGLFEGMVPAGAADSGAISDALSGVLRSATFTIPGKRILYRMAGREAQVNLIIDGFQRIRAPIYGGLTIPLTGGGPLKWYARDVSKWVGHRAYVEVVDRGAGYATVDRILFSDRGAPEKAPSALMREAVASRDLKSAAELASRLDQIFRRSLRAAAAGTAAETEAGVADGLLRAGLLPAPRDASLTAILDERRKLEQELPEPLWTMAAADGTGQDDRVHIRGSVKTLGDTAPRRLFQACAGANQPPAGEGCGRLSLAQRLISPSNPLTARVIVNRIWQHHFGEGIVRTPDDFGTRGERPTHPELLDWLAATFVAGGGGQGSAAHNASPWSIKRMHRILVLSSAYQMDSAGTAAADAADPQNRLLHRMPVRRLEAEAVRDTILAVSGRLEEKVGGPSVLPHLTPFMEGRGRPSTSGPLDGEGRRSLYISVRRNFLTPMLLAFDYPIPFTTIGRRSVSTVPAQALILMNNPFVVEEAQVWARRVLAEPGLDARARVERMYVTAFARPAAEAELTAATGFLADRDREYGAPNDPRSWTDLAHVLFNLKELLFVK